MTVPYTTINTNLAVTMTTTTVMIQCYTLQHAYIHINTHAPASSAYICLHTYRCVLHVNAWNRTSLNEVTVAGFVYTAPQMKLKSEHSLILKMATMNIVAKFYKYKISGQFLLNITRSQNKNGGGNVVVHFVGLRFNFLHCFTCVLRH